MPLSQAAGGSFWIVSSDHSRAARGLRCRLKRCLNRRCQRTRRREPLLRSRMRTSHFFSLVGRHPEQMSTHLSGIAIRENLPADAAVFALWIRATGPIVRCAVAARHCLTVACQDTWSTLGFLESPITASRFGSEELKEPMRLIQSMCARLPVHDAGLVSR